MVFWLATVRGAFDGMSYQWSLLGFGGRGVDGDYWFPLLCASATLIVLAGGWRYRRWAFVAMAIWSILVLIVVIEAVVSNPNDFRFRGDTLDIDVSLVLIGPMLFGVGAVLSILSAWRVNRRRKISAAVWDTRNARWFAVLAAALPLQFVLLRFGDEDSLSDQIGVIITIVQWCMIGRVFRFYGNSTGKNEDS
jgi:hypothetical protein